MINLEEFAEITALVKQLERIKSDLYLRHAVDTDRQKAQRDGDHRNLNKLQAEKPCWKG